MISWLWVKYFLHGFCLFSLLALLLAPFMVSFSCSRIWQRFFMIVAKQKLDFLFIYFFLAEKRQRCNVRRKNYSFLCDVKISRWKLRAT